MRIFIKIFFFCFLLIVLYSCLTVTRTGFWDDEIKDREIDMEVRENIFDDFLWTTPPIYSRKISFIEKDGYRIASVDFGEDKLNFILTNDDEIALQLNDDINKNIFQKAVKSKMNLYYNLDILGTKLIPRERLVTKTRFITRRVLIERHIPVERTRQISVIGPDGRRITKKIRIEDYYIERNYELRTVPEIYTEWKTVYERVIDIPKYSYYHFNLNDGQNVVIYRIKDDNGEINYYFQNTTYLTSYDKNDSFWGDTDVRILIVDTNSNGIYFDDDDKILFNTWNPYEESSAYKTISNYMDNYWYKFRQLKIEKFLTFEINSNYDRLSIRNANSKYFRSDKKGRIIITNLPEEAEVFINGECYFQNNMTGELKRKIEYGVYNLIIKNEDYADFDTSFIINDNNPQFSMAYLLPKKGGRLIFENDYLRSWTIVITDQEGRDKFYYNKNEINLEEGDYKIDISASGYNIKKNIKIKHGMDIVVNYGREIEKSSK